MTSSEWRPRIWCAYFSAEYNCAYWNKATDRVGWWDRTARGVLALAAVVSVAAVFSEGDWRPGFAILGAAAGIIATVVVPMFELDRLRTRALAFRDTWVALKAEYSDLWHSLENDNCDVSAIAARWKALQAAEAKLETAHEWVPSFVKVRDAVYDQACINLAV